MDGLYGLGPGASVALTKTLKSECVIVQFLKVFQHPKIAKPELGGLRHSNILEKKRQVYYAKRLQQCGP